MRCPGNGAAVLTLVCLLAPGFKRAGTMATRTGALGKAQRVQRIQPACRHTAMVNHHTYCMRVTAKVAAVLKKTAIPMSCRASNGSIPAASQGYYQGRFTNGMVSQLVQRLRVQGGCVLPAHLGAAAMVTLHRCGTTTSPTDLALTSST